MASRGKKKQTEARDMKNTQMNRQTDGISGTTGAGGVNGKSRTDRKIKILKTALVAAAGCAALYIAAGLAYAAVVCRFIAVCGTQRIFIVRRKYPWNRSYGV